MTTLAQPEGRTPQLRAAHHAQRLLTRIGEDARALADQRALGAMASRLIQSREHQHLKPLSTADTMSFVQNVRRDLAARHSGTRFFVYADMPRGLRVSWVDGPTTLQVSHSVAKFKLQVNGPTAFHRVFGGAESIVVRRSFSPALLCRAATVAFEANSRVLIGVRRPSADQLFANASATQLLIEELQMTVLELVHAVAEGLDGAH